jgi:hypothetical protein
VASKSLAKWPKMLLENWGACVWSSQVFVCRCSDVCVSPAAGGAAHLPFIGQGEGELQACRTVQLHGGAWCAMP